MKRFEKGFCAYNIVQDRWMLPSAGDYAGHVRRYVAETFDRELRSTPYDDAAIKALWADARAEGWRVFPIVARLIVRRRRP